MVWEKCGCHNPPLPLSVRLSCTPLGAGNVRGQILPQGSSPQFFPITLASSRIVTLPSLSSWLQAESKLAFLSSVTVTVMSHELMITPRYWMVWEGIKTDLSGWTMNPRERKSCTVACMLSTQASSDSASSRKSSRNAVDICPCCRKCANTGLRSFVNFLGANASPLGRQSNCQSCLSYIKHKNFLFCSSMGTE